MNTPAHPSPDTLSAFIDQELTPSDRTPVETHLRSCPGCKAMVEDFVLFNDLGPRVEESLPGEAYWSDLPDRILARLASEEAQAGRRPVPDPSTPFWKRLLHPAGSWRWAPAAGLAAVLVIGAWALVRDQPHPGNPAPLALDETAPVRDNTASTGGSLVASLPEDDPFEDDGEVPAMSPDSFSRRVIMTFGGAGNLGTSLDMVPGRPLTPLRGGSPLGTQGTQVTHTLPPLGAQARAELEGVVTYGCGENPLERAFLAAVKAEEAGDYRLAGLGYRLIRSLVDPRQPLYSEADYRLTYLKWRERMRMSADSHRPLTLDKLQELADRSYEVWAETRRERDCQRAWCLNRTLTKLAAQVPAESALTPTPTRMAELKDCAHE